MNTSIFRRFWVAISAAVIAFYATVLNRCQIVGGEQVPKQGGVLFVANHISAFDTVLLPAAIIKQRPWKMVWAPAKEELFRNRLLGALFRSWGAFPVRRGRDLRAGKELGRLMKADAVMLFPEGTRHKDGQLGVGNRGVGKLIYEHRPVVIPVSLVGLNRWRVRAWGQQAVVRFGAPIDCADLFELTDQKATHVLIVERVMAAIAAGIKCQD
ncbi:MAG TPA: lysophospholipid acyltransferase family protein [Pelovirga sp.]|nr:lysophospholipid acyltransferase family protein [Pelovirga sp.]